LPYVTPQHGARPVPDWLPTGMVEDEVLGHLKTGKEAEVFLVERRSLEDGRCCLLAHKRYRPTSVSKGVIEGLGFTKARSFVNDTVYHEGKRFRYSRDKRAVERMTDYGKRLLADRWVGHELEMAQRMWDTGASVPYPVELTEDGMLMEFVGDERGAAPRLVNARLSTDEARIAYEQIVADLHRFADASIVHADLSPFNVLWWQGRIWIIDLPQATDLVLNPHGFDLLHHDVVAICTWFARKGIDCDGEALFADLLTTAL
jgi:RIO kinase 1